MRPVPRRSAGIPPREGWRRPDTEPSGPIRPRASTGGVGGSVGRPVSRSRTNPASSRIVRPSSRALVSLDPAPGPDDDVVGLLRHRARGLAAAGEDRLLGRVAREALERPGDDDGQPGEGLLGADSSRSVRRSGTAVGRPPCRRSPGASRRRTSHDRLGDDGPTPSTSASSSTRADPIASIECRTRWRARGPRPARRAGSSGRRGPATAAGLRAPCEVGGGAARRWPCRTRPSIGGGPRGRLRWPAARVRAARGSRVLVDLGLPGLGVTDEDLDGHELLHAR